MKGGHVERAGFEIEEIFGFNRAKHADRDDINNLGGYAGLITQTPSDASAEEMVPGDIATAKHFGERVKAVVDRWSKAA